MTSQGTSLTADGVVLDASAAVDLVLGTPVASSIRHALAGRTLHAPQVIVGEVMSALARLARAGHLTEDGATRAVADFVGAPVERHSDAELATTAWRLRDNLRVTDGLYVALAQELGLPLLTSDARLARAVRQFGLCRLHDLPD